MYSPTMLSTTKLYRVVLLLTNLIPQVIKNDIVNEPLDTLDRW